MHRLVEGHPLQRRRPPRRDKARRAVGRLPRLLGRRVRVGGRPVLSHGDGFLADVVLGKEPQERPRPVARELRPLQRSVGSVARAELVDQRRRELVRLRGVSSDVARERLRRGGLVLERRLVDAHEGRVDDRHRQRRHQLVDPWARRSGLRIRRLRCLRCPVTRRPVQLELQQRRRQRERARQLSDRDNLPGAEGQQRLAAEELDDLRSRLDRAAGTAAHGLPHGVQIGGGRLHLEWLQLLCKEGEGDALQARGAQKLVIVQEVGAERLVRRALRADEAAPQVGEQGLLLHGGDHVGLAAPARLPDVCEPARRQG